jgi:hypothetical protein
MIVRPDPPFLNHPPAIRFPLGYDYQLLDQIDLWLDDLSKGTEALHGSDAEVGVNMEELAATIYSPIAIDLNGGKR